MVAFDLFDDKNAPRLILTASGGVLNLCAWSNSPHLRRQLGRYADGDSAADSRAIDMAIWQLKEYVAGRRTVFDITYDLSYGTLFQQRVWHRLATLAHGTTISYGRLAADLGLSGVGIRAAAAAIGANPISIILPCHRVVGANGSLTGYAGGVDIKCRLLSLEGIEPPPDRD